MTRAAGALVVVATIGIAAQGRAADAAPASSSENDATNAEEVTASGDRAATATSPENAAAEVEDDTRVEVVVRGRPRPATAGRLTRDRRLLSAAPHGTGSDLLRTLPGMFLTQHSGEGKAHQLFFRGFDAVHGQDLEVTVAGVPVNEVSNVHGQGYADLHFVIPETVQELELLAGPFDPEQGDFAVAGSARYRLGYPTPGISTKAGLGSFGQRRALLAFRPEARPESDFTAVELYDSDGFGVRRASRRVSLLTQATGELSSRTAWRVMGGYYAGEFESPGVLRLDDLRRGLIGRGASYDPNQGGHSMRAQLVGEMTWVHADGDTRLTPYVVRRQLGMSYNYTGALFNPTTDLTTQSNRATTFGLSSEHQRRVPLFTDQDKWRVGVSAQHDSIDQSQVVGSLPTRVVDADVAATRAALWTGLSLHGVPRTVVHAGLRADALWFETADALADVTRESHGVHVGPKLGADVALAPGWRLQVAGARGFRSPQARSLGDGEATPFTRVTAAEVGTRYSSGRRFSASLSAFSSWLEDDLVFDETTSRNERAPSSRRSGIAVEFTTITRQLASSCGGTFTESVFTASDQRFSAGQSIPYVPRLVARCDLERAHALTQWSGHTLVGGYGWGQQLVWQRPLPYAEVNPGFSLTDLSLWLRWSAFELRLDAENLFDAAWTDGEFVYASNFAEATPSALPERHVTIGAPRSWMLTLGFNGLRL